MKKEGNLTWLTKTTNKKSWQNVIKTQAIDFCLATGLHGYKYIVQPSQTKTERIIWGIIVSASLCCSLVFMRVAWEYNSAHTTLTVIESTHHGIWNYPYPAVSICNNNQVSFSRAQEFVNNLTIPEDMSRNYILGEMKLLVEMLDPGIFNYDVHTNLSTLQDIFEANNYTALEVMKLVRQDCSSLFKFCKWKGIATPCDRLFEETFTRDGICCSFNYYTSESILTNKTEPKRLTACGYQTGLTVLVNPEPQDYHSSLYGSYGVKVIFHYPYDYPVRSSEFKLVGLGVQSFLGISPEETYSTPGVRELSLKARDCIYDDEKLPKLLRSLKRNYTWIKYSYVNCLNDCRTNVILEKCGCIPYYIPQNGSRVCNLKDMQCLADIRSVYDTSWPGNQINSADLPDADINIKERPCGCLLDCCVYRYPVDSTQSILDLEKFYSESYLESNNTKNYSLINVFFTDLVSIQYRRDIYYNWKNLFASFGGLLGLFVGFSLMTGFELVYFFVVRVIANKCIGEKKKIDIRNFK